MSTFDVRKVIMIQRLYRRRFIVLSRVAEEYPDITGFISGNTTYADMVRMATNAEVITKTKKLLERIFAEKRDVTGQVAVIIPRFFLTAYMIHHFSINVFPTVNEPVVQNVMTCAREMLEHFNQLLVQLKAGDKNAKCVEFQEVFLRYTRAFMEWHRFEQPLRVQRWKDTLDFISRAQSDISPEQRNGPVWDRLEAQANQLLDVLSKEPNMALECETLRAHRYILLGGRVLGGPVIPPIPANPYLPVNQVNPVNGGGAQANPVNGGGAPGGQQ